MQNETGAVGALAKALTFETWNREFDDTPEHQACVVINQLLLAGFEIVPKVDEPAEEAPGYDKALAMLKGDGIPCGTAVSQALGGASPDGPEGNVCGLWDNRRREFARSCLRTARHVPPEARIVWNGETPTTRRIDAMLGGKAVPTGRVVEVTYLLPDGRIEETRHAEIAFLDKVSYDPTPVPGRRVLAARVDDPQARPGAVDFPQSVARVTVATDTTADGTNVRTFGWSEDGQECWLLNHFFVPSLRAAA